MSELPCLFSKLLEVCALFGCNHIFGNIMLSLVHAHMWLEGCPNPNQMEQSWECTFLRLFNHANTKSASKTNSIIGLKRYQQASTANRAHYGRIGSAT